jgi:hypothetical protein
MHVQHWVHVSRARLYLSNACTALGLWTICNCTLYSYRDKVPVFTPGTHAGSAMTNTYAIIALGNGSVQERKLGHHTAGAALPGTLTVLENTVANGVRRVVVTRPMGGGGADYYTFRAAETASIGLISAVGSSAAFGYHKAHSTAKLFYVPTPSNNLRPAARSVLTGIYHTIPLYSTVVHRLVPLSQVDVSAPTCVCDMAPPLGSTGSQGTIGRGSFASNCAHKPFGQVSERGGEGEGERDTRTERERERESYRVKSIACSLGGVYGL